MRIGTNIAAYMAGGQLNTVEKRLSASMERLSSGYKINTSKDDPAGMAMTQKLRTQIRALDRSSMNASDGMSVTQTAEGALSEVEAMLQRMRELAVQGANDTNVQKDRDAINAEMEQLTEEIGRIGSTTEFNTMKVFQSGAGNLGGQSKALQVGANADQVIKFQMATISKAANGTVTITEGGLKATPSSVDLGNEVKKASSNGSYGAAITKLDSAIELVSRSRSNLGALQNRLEHTIANADNTAENLQSAESRIRDVDMADEMVKYSKNSILQQAGQSMLAQANQSTQGVLSLLR